MTAREHRLPKKLTLERYLTEDHIAVSTLDGVQSIPEKRLAAIGRVRQSSIRVPYFGSALECLAGTKLVLTATSAVARAASMREDLRVVEAPAEITGFSFQMVWHPRLTGDPAHGWLREQILQLIAERQRSDVG